MVVTPFKRKTTHVDVLVVIVGHQHPSYLKDTADSFDHYNRDAKTSYKIAFAVDHNHDCATELSKTYSHVYCSNVKNGWGRGILRTLIFGLDQFRREGLRWEHLITIDSDTLVVGPCLDHYVSLVKEDTAFVGQKWGGSEPFSAANPGPTNGVQRHVRYLAKLGLFPDKWVLRDYMVAGPFLLWTRKTLNFLEEIGLTPGSALDEIYKYVLFPHDQLTTFVLGVDGFEFADVGEMSMLYCGEVGGEEVWKTGFPSYKFPPYGEVPVYPEGVSVIHPVRSKNFNEGNVRAFFRRLRGDFKKETEQFVWDLAGWNGRRCSTTTWD